MNIRKKLAETLGAVLAERVGSIGGVRGSAAAALCAYTDRKVLLVTSDEDGSALLRNDISFYETLLGGKRTALLPAPSDVFSAGRRAEIICHLEEYDTIVSSKEAVLAPVRKREEISGNIFTVSRGRVIEREDLRERFVALGYRDVAIVAQRGEFSARNYVMDIFPSTSDNPLRIEFFGDEIESLRHFHFDTQRSFDHVETFTVYPAREPAPVESAEVFMDMLPEGMEVFDLEDAVAREGYEGETTTLSFVEDGIRKRRFFPVEGLGITPGERGSIENLPAAIQRIDEDVLIILPNGYQAKRIAELFEQSGVPVPLVDLADVEGVKGKRAITTGQLSEGLMIGGLLILTQKELLGKDLVLTTRREEGGERFLERVEDISAGDYIVHRDHGIGRYRGLSTYAFGNTEVDVAELEYAGNSVLYLPLYNIHKIDKYRAGEGVQPVMDHIGGRTWTNKKKRVKKRIDTMVHKLLELYAQREATRGFSFSSDAPMHREFYSFFPYEETADQVRVIEEICADMESDTVMDRLLCGDVGFGKTEVAMRAAFKAVFDGKQVAVVVPTTVLCEQHFLNFRERFSAFPVEIDYISRFKTPAQIRETVGRVARGEIDIIIATHSILKGAVSFSDLGLLIIDEEHRFGVKQKEKIKELKRGVDCIMLSATPIPRTMQMALSGIRQMSIIETPPEERLAVKTVVSRFDTTVIAGAVNREIGRGGQVFFVHNRVQDIERMRDTLQGLLPDVRMRTAHGQMRARDLEDRILGFINHDYNMLICTNIIGSGVDIPRANTIFINRADTFGLADLYQLKGRVGRGDRKAYAYFLVSPDGASTPGGKKRLRAIEQLSYLGAGLKLAMKDLEIRGAGTLFGYKQSGYINEVGFDIYVEILRKEVQRSRGEEVTEEREPEMELDIDARIPDSYIGNDVLRMSVYRRLSYIGTGEELTEIAKELEDRFGPVPVEVRRLLDTVSLKLHAKKTGVRKFSLASRKCTVSFLSKDRISVDRFFRLAEKFKGVRYRQDGFSFSAGKRDWKKTVASIKDIFQYLAEGGLR